MKILVMGTEERAAELRQRLSHLTEAEVDFSDGDDDEDFEDYDILFDLNYDDDPDLLAHYAELKDVPVFVGAVKHALSESAYLSPERITCKLIGMNALPSFIDREKWELSLLHKPQASDLSEIMEKLGIGYHLVDDRVGMVTPRILLMIINEACYTLQEGTASMEAIDQGMRLGTNYPMGPFAWADAIGVTDVYESLAAIWEDTRDPRYKICPLLKTHYLRNKPFYKPQKAGV